MSYTNQGTIKRAKPRMQVLRGNAYGDSQQESAAYPVGSGVTILSGMVISPLWVAGNSRYEWQKGPTATGVAYFATADSTDPDVMSSGNLVGLSCAGKFEIATAYYKSTSTFTLGGYVKGNSDGEIEDVTASGSGGSTPIIGRVSRVLPATSPVTTGVAPNSSAAGAGVFVDSGSTATTMVVIETMSIPTNGA